MMPNITKKTRAGMHQPCERPAPPAGVDGLLAALDDGRSEGCHLPIVAFRAVANCSGLMDNWNNLAMLSSSTSAAVGLSAWSQDCTKLFASLAIL